MEKVNIPQRKTQGKKITPANLTGVYLSYSVVRMRPFFFLIRVFLNLISLWSSHATITDIYFTRIPHILRSLDCYLALYSLLKYLLDVGLKIISPYLL